MDTLVKLLLGGRRPLLLALAPCLAFAAPALAQDEDEEEDGRLLDEIVVRGVAGGAAAAIRDMRESETLVTIVSEEMLETIPEQSVGEAMSRLPGVSIIRDRGEAQSITIRGADGRLNAVTMNGDRLLAPESTLEAATRGQRTASLNNVTATLVKEIQVFKAVPPNMDGDSIGGAVEIKTKTATDLDDTLFDVTGRVGYNDLSDTELYSGELTWGTRFDRAGRFGMIATVSYEENDRGISGLQAEWDTVDELIDLSTCDPLIPDPDLCTFVPLPEERQVVETYDVIWRGLVRERVGANLTFDFRASDEHLFKVGGWYTEFNTEELRRRLQLRPGASADFTTDTTFDSLGRQVEGSTDGGRVRRRSREGTVDRLSYNAFIEGNHLLGGGDWSLDWRASTTFADQVVRRTRSRWESRADGADVDLNLRGDGVADWTFTNGNRARILYTQPFWGNDPDLLAIGSRGSARIRDDETSDDTMDSFKVDVARFIDLGGDTQLDIKFGYKGRFRDRELWPRTFNFDGDEDNPIFMSQFVGANPNTEWNPFGYDMGIWPDPQAFRQFLVNNTDRFVLDDDNLDERYTVDETVHAYYLMGTLKTGPWTVTAGGRFEDTETDIVARDGAVSSDYDNFLPAVILKYQLNDNTILRGAWTNGLGRPDFFDLRPFFDDDFEFEVDMDTGEAEAELNIQGGNPELEPFEAQSFDASVEYYTDNGGVFSVGVFHKIVENFEYNEELRLNDVSIAALPPFLQSIAIRSIEDSRENNPAIPADLDTLTRFNFVRPVNGDDSTMTGWEVNVQQQFTNLPGFWSGFGVFANYTDISGDSDITADISRPFVVGQFEHVANLQLFYEVEAWTARLAYNRNGVTYVGLGLDIDDGAVVSDPDQDIGVDVEESLDFSFQYRWDRGDRGLWTFYFDLQNLADDDSRNRFLGSQRLNRFIELENGGRSFQLGIRWNR